LVERDHPELPSAPISFLNNLWFTRSLASGSRRVPSRNHCPAPRTKAGMASDAEDVYATVFMLCPLTIQGLVTDEPLTGAPL
jgi:hypothetical protein